MPRRPRKPCAKVNCPNLVEAGETYCPQHKQERQQYFNAKRTDTAERKFYKSTAWKKFREEKLRRDPLCQRCYAKGYITTATIVHHIDEIREGGAWIPDFDEAESLCKSCHSRHHGGW
jgi:5-methylcytosine-specific restriction enzyme A